MLNSRRIPFLLPMLGTVVLLSLLMVPAIAQVAVSNINALPEMQAVWEQEQRDIAHMRLFGKRPPSILADTILSLPIFDDFSTTTIRPNLNIWKHGTGVYVNNRFANNPPSLGVATFDGIGANGLPYSTNIASVGLSDSLVTHPINLSSFAGTPDTATIFLSFYLQAGNREIELRPDVGDSIIVQFKDANLAWHTFFVQGGSTSIAPPFAYHAIRLPGRFCHSQFAFRFMAFGKQNGLFDVWNLDYVRLAANRSLADSAATDLAFSTKPSPLFPPYRSIPYDHFDSRKVGADSLHANFYNHNLDRINFNLDFRADSGLAKRPVTLANLVTVPFGPAIVGSGTAIQERSFRTLSVVPAAFSPLRKPTLPTEITYGFSLREDPIFNTFTANDTITTTAALRDYYAYDDGTHEKAYFVIGNSARVLYQFVASQRDTLSGISFGFDPKSFQFSNAVPLGVIVYRRIKGQGGAINDTALYFSSQVLQRSSSPDGFYYFPMSRPVAVSDTFYVGYQQNVGIENTLYIRADINTAAPGRFFSNFATIWDKYTRSDNALLIRPHFGCNTCPVAIRQRSPVLALKLYPNPAMLGQDLQLEGTFAKVEIQTTAGKMLVKGDLEGRDPRFALPADMPPGIYLVRATARNGSIAVGKLSVQ